VKITLQNQQSKVSLQTKKIKKLILKVLKGERIKESGWINVCFVNNSQIRKFNAKFLKVKGVTDVLAFNLSDENKKNFILADIMVSAQEALIQARNLKTTLYYELSLYVVHGLLHILGYGDHTAVQIKLMRKKESQYVD
jgi:probable rRNA maturation factor